MKNSDFFKNFGQVDSSVYQREGGNKVKTEAFEPQYKAHPQSSQITFSQEDKMNNITPSTDSDPPALQQHKYQEPIYLQKQYQNNFHVRGRANQSSIGSIIPDNDEVMAQYRRERPVDNILPKEYRYVGK